MRVGWGGRQTGVESKNSDLGKNPDFGVPLLNPAYGKCVRAHTLKGSLQGGNNCASVSYYRRCSLNIECVLLLYTV